MITKVHFISLNETEIKAKYNVAIAITNYIHKNRQIIIHNVLIKMLLNSTFEKLFKYVNLNVVITLG